MAKTQNGRPMAIGQMYFEKIGDQTVRKYCVGYLDGKKIGLTAAELEQFADNSCMGLRGFLARLAHAKILIP